MNSQIVACSTHISRLSVSHCGLFIAAASKVITAERYKIYLLAYPTLHTISILSGHEKSILSLNFTYNSRLLISSSCDSFIRIWHVNPNQPKSIQSVWEIHFPDYHFQSIVTNQSGQYIACGDQQGRVAVWNILQKTMTMRWQGLSGCVTAIQIIEGNSYIHYIVIGGNTKKSCSCANEFTSNQEIYGEIKIWSWGTQELLHTFAQADSCNYRVEIFEHWVLLADDSQSMLVNSWPDISHFTLDKVDQIIEIGEYHQIQGIEWFPDGLNYLIFTKLGTVCQYKFEKVRNHFKSNQTIQSDNLLKLIHKKKEKKESITRTFSKLSGFLKKTGTRRDEVIYDRLQQKEKIKVNFDRQLNDAKYSSEHDYLILAFDNRTLLNYDIRYKDTPYRKVGTEGIAYCVRFSPKNDIITVGDENGYLILIDRYTLSIISKTQPHDGCIDFIEFFPDGSRMVTKSKDKTFKIWTLSPQVELLQTLSHDSDSNLSISSDGNWLVVGNNDGSITVHETNTWSSMQLASYQIEVTAVCFAQNSDIIISANLEKTIILTDNRQKEIIKKFEGHADPIISLASSPDGKQFASGGWDFVIKLWSIAKKNFIGNLNGHKDCVNQLSYSPDGKVLFSCSNDKTIKLWGIQRMEIMINLNIEEYQIQSFDVIYDEKIICFTQEDQVIIWYGKEQKVKFKSQWNEEVGAICFTSQKNFIATSIGSKIQLMNISFESSMNIIRDKTASQQNMMESNEMKCNSIVKQLTFSKGRIYATCQDGQIYVFNMNTFSIIHTFKDQDCVASLYNNRLVITAEEKQINIWDGYNFELIRTLPQIWVNNISISDNEQIMVCSNQQMKCIIWDLESYNEQCSFNQHQKQIHNIKFGQNDQVVGSAGEDKIIYIWPVSGKGTIKQLKGHTDSINCFCFINKDFNILSGADDGTIKYWKITTEELVHNLALHTMPIKCIICHEDSAQFSYCFGSNIIVADLHRDILSDIQIQETDCRPLMETQNFQLLKPNGILSRHLGTVFRPQLKNQFILDDELKHSASFLTESSLSGSQLFSKIRQQLLNPKERQQLLDHISKSEFLQQTFDDDLAYAMFNEIYDSLREIHYDNMSPFVQNIFYSVLNCQTTSGKRILQEIFKQQKFSQHLSVKELQYLLSLAKFLKSHIQSLHNSSKYRAWYDKIRDIKELNLQKNSYLSSLLCKSQLLMNMDKTFQTFKLLTPHEIMQNEHFNLFKCEEYQPKCFTYSRSQKIEKQVLQISKLRDKIAQFNFDEFDNYIQDFIFELILELEGLESIDLSYLNLTDEFCEQFCNTFINREYCPDLQIFSNERISHVGQKYLQVLYTKHKSSKLNLHSMNQIKTVQENLNNKVKLLETENFRKRFNPDQIELLKFDMNELKKGLDQQLTKLKQQDDFLSIQEYFERQSETVKRSQALLNFGILGYLNELIFTKSATDYCSYCNKYVCIQCHQQKHETQQPCVLCLKCSQFHLGYNQVLSCEEEDQFNLDKLRQQLYQEFKFNKSVCLYGQLKTLDRIDSNKRSFSIMVSFKFKCKLFSLIQWIEHKIQNVQIYIMFQLSRIFKSKPQSQEDLKAGLFEQLQVLAIDQYNFNNNVFDLEEKIENPSYLIFTIILFFFWYIFSLALPIVFPGEKTVKWEAHFIFLGYLAVVFIAEFSIIQKMLDIVNKPVEGEVKLIRDLSPFKYFSLLFSTSFAKYDFYTDVIFMTVLYRQKDNLQIETLFYLSLIFTILPASITLLQCSFIISSELWYRLHRKNAEKKTLRCINFYSRISILLEHESIGWLLDKFASNTAIKIGRNYVPQKIISSFFKVAFENMPQLVIQLIYQLQLSSEFNFTLILTTITTCISLVMQVFVFLMAKSSFVNEIDQSKMSQRLGLGLSRKQTEEEKEQLKIQLIQQEQKSARISVDKTITRSRISRVTEVKRQFDREQEIELTTNREQSKDTILQI